MCLSGSFDSQFVHLIKLSVKKNLGVYSGAAVIVGFCPGVPVYKGITMVLSLFRSHSWLVVVYCLVFCSGSCEPRYCYDRYSLSSKYYKPSALLLRSIFPFEFILRAARVL